ncbi:MAG: hypothetical protein EAZ18_13030 [Oscillatoriales cyanobacterium]|nr:MAG: hypothetical protein EAZ18_13030 [Oscillatoriales cyanobacterium]
MIQKIKWDWYGFWIVDWLNSDDAWDAYDIWRKAYLAANPEIEEARENSYMDDQTDGPGTELDLIENHYNQSLIAVQESFVYKAFIFLRYPIRLISTLLWNLSSLIRRGKLRHQI